MNRRDALRSYLFSLHTDGVLTGAESRADAIFRVGAAVTKDLLALFLEVSDLKEAWRKVGDQYRRGVEANTKART